MTSRTRRGFSMVELLTVFLVLSILASIAILKYIDLKRTAWAARIASEFGVVRVAAYNYWAAHGEWAPDGSPGVVPPALAPELPQGFSFTSANPDYTLDWDVLPLGSEKYLVGVTFRSPDQALTAKLIRTIGDKHPFFIAGGAVTYIFVGPDGRE